MLELAGMVTISEQQKENAKECPEKKPFKSVFVRGIWPRDRELLFRNYLSVDSLIIMVAGSISSEGVLLS